MQMEMQTKDFEKIKQEFEKSNVDGKINIYVQVEGLSQSQYKELLHLFPLDELHKLEQALQ